ncbi:MAG: hypothetical protein V4555_09760 [Acidobacteriota bacterium]
MTVAVASPAKAETRSAARVRLGVWMRWLLVAASVVILTLGAVECVYGNTDSGDVYGSDAVQYLDIARAMERGDWHSALNPLWSQGYPALLAAARPLFTAGPVGDWRETRVLNCVIFAADYAAFLFLLMGLVSDLRGRARWLVVSAGLMLFVASQVCLGQVSRVSPDELVSAFFFLACGLILRWVRAADDRVGRGVVLGLVLGVGFLVKAVFLLLSCGMLVLLAAALWSRRRSLRPLLAAAVVFAVIAGSYGTALSRSTGKVTLGEAGAINYAWHVDRLQKWVHWEGGVEPAAEAWPKPWIARFAQWDTRPPEFGLPVHPSVIVQERPRVYGFAAPIHATYVPYFDPPYWYAGYKHVFGWRYQVIALAKSLGDLVSVLLALPMFYAVVLAAGILLWGRRREGLRSWLREHWAVAACGLLGVAIYLPVHLEGRYLASMLAVIGLCAITAGAAEVSREKFRVVMAVLALGLFGALMRTQLPVWRNVLRHKSPMQTVDWKIGQAVLAARVPARSPVGVVAWTANLHSDWAYMAQVEITSETATPEDFDLFWKQDAAGRRRSLDAFRRAGATVVFSYGKPDGADGVGWTHLGDTPMWMYRL